MYHIATPDIGYLLKNINKTVGILTQQSKGHYREMTWLPIQKDEI